MPTSQLYDSTRRHLAAQLPAALDSQLDTLALVVVGISQSLSAQLGKIARALPLDTSQMAKEQRVRRLLDNERLTQADHFQPLAKAALHGLKGQRVQLLIDRVLPLAQAAQAHRLVESNQVVGKIIIDPTITE